MLSETQGITKPNIIPLTRGQSAIVDPEDHETLTRVRWYADWSASIGGFYARRQESIPGTNRQRGIRMHRQILGLGLDDRRDVDHINGNTLDNRKENLRICTRSENIRNSGMRSGNSTGFKGVSERKGRYYAQIVANGRKKWLGQRATAEEAYALYVAASRALHGEFSHV